MQIRHDVRHKIWAERRRNADADEHLSRSLGDLAPDGRQLGSRQVSLYEQHAQAGSDGCETLVRWAARPKCLRSASATKYSNWRKVGIAPYRSILLPLRCRCSICRSASRPVAGRSAWRRSWRVETDAVRRANFGRPRTFLPRQRRSALQKAVSHLMGELPKIAA